MNRATIGQCVLVMAICSSGQAQDVRLKYLAHYDPVSKEVLGVENVLDHHALISSAGALTLVDLNELQPGGAQKFIDSLMLPSVSSYTRADGYVYVNLRLGGLAVVRLNPLTMELSVLQEIDEPDVIFERMAIVGDRLYVAAHAYGLRIFDITDPALPALVGSLPSGFDDAFAVAVSGNTAYVADGAGGLKIVDITVEAAPRILEGENPESAAGTSQDVMVIDDHVYVAAGGAGVAVYDPGTVAGRTVYDTPVAAQQLARVGSYLAIADLGGVQVFAIETDGSLTPAASELAMRRMRDTGAYTTRLWHGVSAWGENRILAADWDSMDVYELVDPSSDDQADVTASTQRLRFAPAGGTKVVRINNDGSGTLNMTSISSTEPTFGVQPGSGTLLPGEFLDLTITYAGGDPGEALVLIDSNDADESPLPIQVFGETIHLDPGEPAVPFTLEAWTYDHSTQEFQHSPFELAAHAGRIVYFHVYTIF
ncbi:MAG: LVIVD repeat-containing protein [Planctomycetota bacterium]|jgi:hypothetical protein